VEIELKLVLPGQADESAIVACLRENGYTVEEIDRVQHVDTYLDTFDWSLLKNKLGLRYRVSNGTGCTRLKASGPSRKGSQEDGNGDSPRSTGRYAGGDSGEADPQAC